MKLIIDRIEEDVIVAEAPDKSLVNLPLRLFPEAREGDSLSLSWRPRNASRPSPLEREIAELERQLRKK